MNFSSFRYLACNDWVLIFWTQKITHFLFLLRSKDTPCHNWFAFRRTLSTSHCIILLYKVKTILRKLWYRWLGQGEPTRINQNKWLSWNIFYEAFEADNTVRKNRISGPNVLLVVEILKDLRPFTPKLSLLQPKRRFALASLCLPRDLVKQIATRRVWQDTHVFWFHMASILGKKYPFRFDSKLPLLTVT